MTHGSPVPERSADPSAGQPPRYSEGQSSPTISATVIKRANDLADQAAFLWSSRSFVARSSAVTFTALANLDQRIFRLVAALSERPGLAERLRTTQDTPFRSGHAFVTAAVALRSGAVSVFDELVERLGEDDALLAPLTSSLSWFEYAEVRAHVERLLSSSRPAVVRLGILSAVAHRFDPGMVLEEALDALDPLLRAAALEAAGRLGALDLRAKLLAALDDEDDACRFWAAWSAVRLGERAGLPVLGRFAVAEGRFAKPACDMALRALEPDQAVAAHTRFMSEVTDMRMGVLAAGIVGDPMLVSWLFTQMEAPPLARHAGAAFSLVTGRDLRRDDLDGAPPPDVIASSVESGTDVDGEKLEGERPTDPNGHTLPPEADDEFVWPDSTRIRQWWDRNAFAFVGGIRYLAGVPVRPAELTGVLRVGNQQQRAAAALELGLHRPDAPMLDVTAPAHRQDQS